MSASQRLRGMLAAVVLAMAAMLAVASGALGAGITLERAISPPQAVARGTGAQSFSFNISFISSPDRYTFSVRDPGGAVVFGPREVGASGRVSPITAVETWSPPANATPGRYEAEVAYYSTTGFEASAKVTFDVADQIGALRLVKFEDVNGNGRQDAGEPGLPGWGFTLTNPQGNRSDTRTGSDGSVTLTNVPAGTWRVDEVLQNGWINITPTGGTVAVPAGAEGEFRVGNARPAPLSGTVWVDANRNQVIDTGETRFQGATLTLTGSGGATIGTTTSAGDGTYVFPNLPPGSYNVQVTTPTGYTATTPVARTDRIITSGVPNTDNDFGIVQPTATTQQTPDIGIDKRGPATAAPGEVFTYTIVVTNRSSFAARNVEVTDLVPAELTLVAVPTGATIRNGVVTWSLGTMRAGASRTLTMRVRVNPNTTVTRLVNTATVTATGLPPRRDRVTTTLKRKAPVVRRTGAVTG